MTWVLEKIDEHLANGGRGVEVEFGNDEQVLRVSGDSSKGTHMSITLVPDPNASDGVGDNEAPMPPATAIIKWGNDGYRTEVEVDWKFGTVVTVAAGFVEVIARHEGQQGDPSILLGAFIAYLPYFKPGNATKTQEGGAILAATTGPNILVPPYAIRVTPCITPAVTPPTVDPIFEILDGAGVPIHSVEMLRSSAMDIPLPNRSRFVRIITGADALTDSSFVFELSL